MSTPFSPNTPTAEIGVVDTRSGILTLDTPLQEYFKKLHVVNAGTNGVLLVKDTKTGGIVHYRGLSNGDYVWVVGNAIVSSATIDGVALTSDVASVDWYGGF
jgi:hypothetical protein